MMAHGDTHSSSTLGLIKYGVISINIIALTALTGCSTNLDKLEPKYSFTLTGGHFFGPGPIVPDTALPDGQLKGIKFDKNTFSGYATFSNDGRAESRLSDGKTLINQNIDAGELDIGDGSNPLLLVAVKTGKNKGREYYSLDKHYRFVWKVDLALDPGFAEGIIQINDFTLHTGLVKVSTSLQTQQGIPGGYDQAGTMPSGKYMAGRVGDFDQDGYMDGVLVAAPNVPLESAMLPGAPVGNQRGFITDIHIAPHLACELTVQGLLQFKEPIAEVIRENKLVDLTEMLSDMRNRIDAASLNMERAMRLGAWQPRELKTSAVELTGYLESAKILSFMSHAFTQGYPNSSGVVSGSVKDAINNMFVKLEILAPQITALNQKTGETLPAKRQSFARL